MLARGVLESGVLSSVSLPAGALESGALSSVSLPAGRPDLGCSTLEAPCKAHVAETTAADAPLPVSCRFPVATPPMLAVSVKGE